MKTPITGGMPDTMEYFTLFHLELTMGGPMSVLCAMLMVVIMMVVAIIVHNNMMRIIDESVARRSN